ncbi:MAG: proline dehydrogenase family protein [Solirubrobacterales bacterium]|nr:proline dehydrogenase family protein [Solirubrobacterales bacterium]
MGVSRSVLLHLATSDDFERAVRRTPGGARAAWRAASRYVGGRTLDAALQTIGGLQADGHRVSVDLFGERVTDPARADGVLAGYRELAARLPAQPEEAWLSVDLSHLAVTAGAAAAADRLAVIAESLPPGRRIQVGAEDAAHAEVVRACVLDVAARGLADRLGATVQANLWRASADAEAFGDAGVHVRLVKGAYLESAGSHPHGEATDMSFLRLGFGLAERGGPWSAATHDGRMREALLLAHGEIDVEQLLGVRPDVVDQLRDRGVPTRVYVPFGGEWFRYWMRRVAESRGA